MASKISDFMETIRTLKRPTVGQFIWMGLALVIAVGSFAFLRGFVACWRLTALPGIQPSSCAGQATGPVTTPEGDETPVAGTTATPAISVPQVPLPEPWDGASRVNVLVMGYDFGD